MLLLISEIRGQCPPNNLLVNSRNPMLLPFQNQPQPTPLYIVEKRPRHWLFDLRRSLDFGTNPHSCADAFANTNASTLNNDATLSRWHTKRRHNTRDTNSSMFSDSNLQNTTIITTTAYQVHPSSEQCWKSPSKNDLSFLHRSYNSIAISNINDQKHCLPLPCEHLTTHRIPSTNAPSSLMVFTILLRHQFSPSTWRSRQSSPQRKKSWVGKKHTLAITRQKMWFLSQVSPHNKRRDVAFGKFANDCWFTFNPIQYNVINRAFPNVHRNSNPPILLSLPSMISLGHFTKHPVRLLFPTQTNVHRDACAMSLVGRITAETEFSPRWNPPRPRRPLPLVWKSVTTTPVQPALTAVLRYRS